MNTIEINMLIYIDRNELHKSIIFLNSLGMYCLIILDYHYYLIAKRYAFLVLH